METKVKLGPSALKIIGLIYCPLGSLFVIIGIALGIFVNPLFLAMFGGIGGIFVVLGVIFLVLVAKKKKRYEALVSSGKYFWADVAEISYDASVRINGRCPRILIVRYVAPNGEIRMFRSRPITKSCPMDLVGRKVRVYADESNLRNYYVDVEPLLQNIVEY